MGTVISTGDKDMVQLLTPGVTLVNTMSNEVLDGEAAMQKYGVRPDQFIDYLTLMGDTSDNVPGVAKVGPKTAQKWIDRYGNLDELLLHADDVTGAVGENLRSAREWLPQARRLITIRCDIALPVAATALQMNEPDLPSLHALAERYDLRSWVKSGAAGHQGADAGTAGAARTQAGAGPAAKVDAVLNEDHAVAPLVPVRYDTVTTMEQLEVWIARIEAASLTAFDTETNSLDPMTTQLVGFSLCVTPYEACYVPLAHCGPDQPLQLNLKDTLARMKPWLENPAAKKVGQHLKYDQHVLANQGIYLQGIVHDTLLQSYVLESHQPHSLESLARRHLNRDTISYEAVTGKGVHAIGFEQVALDMATPYAAEDADITLQVHNTLFPRIAADAGLLSIYQDLELPVQQVLWRMERNGVLLDGAHLERQSGELGARLMALEAQVHAAAGHPFNLNSPKQIQAVLFEEQGLPVRKKTPGGDPSTDEAVLAELALDYPIPHLLLEYRSLAKLKSTYTDKLPRMVNAETGRVHTHYAQAVAVTGRLSSSDPNLQNIPVRTTEGRRIREAFIAPVDHVIVSADYSQIELRIMAHLSQDAGLLAAFAAGQDVHRATAAEIFGVAPDEVSAEQRRAAKTINFGLIYGMSVFGLAGQLGIERQAAQIYMERYFSRYPGVAQYMERTRDSARRLGYVETVFGRRLWLPEINTSSAARRQGAERAAINAPMQGTAADLIKRAMLAVQHWIETEQLSTLLVMQVHDELVLEVPNRERERVAAALPGLMCGVATLAVPLLVEVGVGANWDEAH